MRTSSKPMSRSLRPWALVGCFVLAWLCASPMAAEGGALWTEIDLGIKTGPMPMDARVFRVDVAGLDTRLRAAVQHPVELSIPRPDHGVVVVRLEPTETMAPELAKRFPNIATFAGRGLGPDGPVTVRMTWSPMGLQVWVREGRGSFFVEPTRVEPSRVEPTLEIDGAVETYVSYRGQATGEVECGVMTPPVLDSDPPAVMDGSIASKGATEALNVFRLAVASTSEFTQNVGSGSSWITFLTILTTINQVNDILEAEARVRLQLIPETVQLIYFDANDPYTDNSKTALILENAENLDAVLGAESFDIGHVFSWGVSGGLAQHRAVCHSTKARGVSGWSPSNLDWIQIVAHEFGHQLGAFHSFNSVAGECGPERNALTAWEAGSGRSLMSYGGGSACDVESVAGPKLSRLHMESRDEIRERVDYVATYQDCGTVAPLAGSDPTVLALGYRPIPMETPFRLQALAVDPDDETLVFCWGQRDLGAASPPHLDNGSRPLFALDCSPTEERSGTLQYHSRLFPELSALLAGSTTTVGQTLPTTDRALYMGVSVRDGQGGYAESHTVIDVTDQAGPFRITAPHFDIWDSTVQTVQWDVAGTTAPPVSCPKVDILLSLDGGQTFPTTLASGTTNDGHAWIFLPAVWTNQGRIQVRCSDHIFFDISDSNLWIRTSM